MAERKANAHKKRIAVKVLCSTSILVVLFAVGGFAVSLVVRRPETTRAIRGMDVAHRMGCFACHGTEGVGGVADPTSPAGRVPDWTPETVEMYVSREAHIREWILYGAPRSQTEDIAPSEYLIPMPAYEGLISEEELEELVAYFKAVSGWARSIPDDAHEGRRIAQRLGCFDCHGPSGMGGVPNPGSFTGFIPPWDGEAYEELVRGEPELREWILEGKIRRLWDNPLARHFLEKQIIQMPAYRAHLSEEELNKIVAYIEWLRRDRM